MSTNITDVFCDFLNEYCSRTVWNEPQREYRHNIKLNLQEARPQINVWSMDTETLSLPSDSTQYFVYMAPLEHFAGLDVRSSGWQSATTLLSNSNIHLRFHDSTGKRLFSPACWIRSSVNDDTKILIAIDTRMLKTISDTNENDIYIGVYYDSDEVNDIVTDGYRITAFNKNEALQKATAANFVYLNGYAVKSITLDDLQIGDYLECVKDNNILTSFSLDLSNDSDARMYVSDDGQSKYIIHIPKTQNPNNLLISHDTCDFYVYPRNLTQSNLKGRYFHRAQGVEKYSFIQITHNDFGVPTALVDQFRGFIGTDEVVIDCYIRNHSRTKTLVRDKNYIDFLYQLNDTQILDFLEEQRTGSGIDSIPFWSARHLERSKYIAFLKDTSVQRLNHELDAYTNALGYINTASLLCNKVYKYRGMTTTTNSFNLTVVLPLAYQWKVCPYCNNANSVFASTCDECGATLDADKPLMAIVSVNGIKVPFNKVTSKVVTRIGAIGENSAHLSINVDYGKKINSTDEIIVEVQEVKSFDTYVMSPTSSIHSYWYKTGNYKLFELIRTNTPADVVVGSFDTKYAEQSLTSSMFTIEEFGELSHITFGSACYGKKFMLQSNKGSFISDIDIETMFEECNNFAFVPEDDAYKTEILFATPIENFDVHETGTCTGIDIYKQEIRNGKEFYVLVKGFDGVDVANFVSDVGINKKRISFPESAFGNTYAIVSHTYERQPVVTDQDICLYLNGRYLVENVDYHKVTPDVQYPYQVVVHNVSYLKENANTLECYGSEAEAISYDSNFVTSDVYVNSKNKPALYYDTFTNVYTDGEQLSLLDWINGRLDNTSTMVPTRFGALYLVKTDLPPVIRKYLNESILEDDLANLKKISDYFATVTPDDPAIYPIYYSHRLYSIYLNRVIDDVLDGTITIPAETDPEHLTEYLQDYEYLKQYDLPLLFTESDVPVLPSADGQASVSSGLKVRTSVINRTFIDVYPSYRQRLVPGTALYAVFNALIKYITPEDTVVDTVAVDTSVSDNQGNE